MTTQDKPQVILITGAARRIGAGIARHLHAAGYRVVLHYHHSGGEAEELVSGLNAFRPDSTVLFQADLTIPEQVDALAHQASCHWGRLDGLVNNASRFYPTALSESTQRQWNELLDTNLRAPYFLTQALAPTLARQRGSIVNLVDVHAQRPLKGYAIYSIAKAGLAMLTQSLARELAPGVRVNGVAPGPILWPEAEASLTEDGKQAVLERIPLARQGTPEEIASTVQFLLEHPYITGQVLAVDGGRSLYS